jgi:hypothetical protein
LHAFVAWHEVDKQLIKSLMGFSENCENSPSEILCRGSDLHCIIKVSHENRQAAIFFRDNTCEFILEKTLEINVSDNFKTDIRKAEMTQCSLPYLL